MQKIIELSQDASGLLLFFRHVSDPLSGRVARVPDGEDHRQFALPTQQCDGGVRIDKQALLQAHRELKQQGLIEVRPSYAPSAMGEVYLVRDTIH